MSISVTVAVAVPPPLNGRSYVTSEFVRVLEASAIPVTIVNTGSPSYSVFASLRARGSAFVKILRGLLGKPSVLYIAASGGLGLYFELLYVLIGCVSLRRRVFIHHHSMAYIARYSLPMNLICLCPNIRHIFLSDEMRKLFSLRYRVASSTVIGNEWVVPPDHARPIRTHDRPPVLGHLSNLSPAKGIRTVLEVFSRARIIYPDLRLELAGPAAPELAEELRRLCEADSYISYLGPIYGAEKQAWLRRVDIFLFPSQYTNEAYPLVICEALAAGCSIVASSVGSISEMLRGCEVAFAGPVDECEAAVLRALDRKLSALDARLKAKTYFESRRLLALQSLADMLADIQACSNRTGSSVQAQ